MNVYINFKKYTESGYSFTTRSYPELLFMKINCKMLSLIN